MPVTKAEQYEKTRAALLDVAHELFAEKGYADTSTEEIVKRAGVTRGALYYHFKDKKEIFQAVFERFRAARAQIVVTKMLAAEGDLWERIVETGSVAFIDSLTDTQAQRIIFRDGPAVLDSEVWHKNVQGVDLISQSLKQLSAAGVIEEAPEALARLLWGAFLEAGLFISNAADADKAQHEMHQGLRYLLGLLRSKH